MYTHIYISISLSLYIYIYICMYLSLSLYYIYIYIYYSVSWATASKIIRRGGRLSDCSGPLREGARQADRGLPEGPAVTTVIVTGI